MANNKQNQHHVTHRESDDKWIVKKTGTDRATRVFDTKKEAVDEGRKISRNQETEFVIHKEDGTIQKKDSHGNDPNPPKDKNN